MEKELPLSEKPREEMRRERITLSNAPPDSLEGRVAWRPLVYVMRQFQQSGSPHSFTPHSPSLRIGSHENSRGIGREE